MTGSPRDAVHIRVPASSANLGPGYDSFGLALGLWDDVFVSPSDGGLQIAVEGFGADTVPTDQRHLVFQAARRAYEAVGRQVPGMRLHCVNRIPHGGGQGSSAAAIVAGMLVARTLLDGGSSLLDDDAVYALATEMEGHPDNVAPALFGGFTVAWMSRGGGGEPVRDTASELGEPAAVRSPRVIRMTPDPRVRAVVYTADASCATTTARAVLPAQIPHADAAANSARAAVLVHALTQEPDLLFDATEDYLHQRYREAVMPQTAHLLHRLRADGHAAVLSGAGPSVLVLDAAPTGRAADASNGVARGNANGADRGRELPEVAGFHVRQVSVPTTGASVDGAPFGADAHE